MDLIATVGDPAANTYALIPDADALAETRIGAAAAAWFAASDDDGKSRALITATRDIDSLASGPALKSEVDFKGARESDTQALEFPRDYLPGVLPPTLIAATIELAIVYYADPTGAALEPVQSGITNVKAGDVSVTWDPLAPASINGTIWALQRLPGIVQRLLGPLLIVRILTNVGWGFGGEARRSS
jgi:hypothetical protein